MTMQIGPARGHENDGFDRARADDLSYRRPSPVTPTDWTGRKTTKACDTLVDETVFARFLDEEMIGQAQRVLL